MTWWSVRWTRLWSRIRNRFRLGRRHGWRIRKSRRLRRKLHELAQLDNGSGIALAYLRKVDPFVFEELILSSFEEANIAVTRNPRYTGDGGADGVIHHRGKVILVQAKRYGRHIQQSHVRDFAALCQQRGQLGLFVHTGRTGEGAREAAMSLHILSGAKLIQVLTNGSAAKSFLDEVTATRGAGHPKQGRTPLRFAPPSQRMGERR